MGSMESRARRHRLDQNRLRGSHFRNHCRNHFGKHFGKHCRSRYGKFGRCRFLGVFGRFRDIPAFAGWPEVRLRSGQLVKGLLSRWVFPMR
jgi:hypothetical protein